MQTEVLYGNGLRTSYTYDERSQLTELYYLRARYYNTGIGRFTQEDVIYNDGLNLYAYCSSNPVMYADPSGYSCEPKAAAENSKGNNTSKEIILAIEKTHESARNTLVLELQKTGAFKNGSESYNEYVQILDS